MQLAKPYSDRLFLVGLMGVGKTTLGKLMASHLGLRFVDCDQEIECRSGADIPWIFDLEGEDGFRDREASVLDALTKETGLLLATGGGVVLREQNRKLLRSRGLVLFLDAEVELLLQRTKKDKNRPLLATGNSRKILEKLKEERDPLYREVADLHVTVHDENTHKVMERIMEMLIKEGLVE